jgi:hypothetical protein
MNNSATGVYISAGLYNKLKYDFKSIGDIKNLNDLDVKFLTSNNINCELTINQLKSNIINNNISVDRMKDFSKIINVKDIGSLIPQLMDLFNSILQQEYLDNIMTVMAAAFDSKIIEYDIFALQKDKEQDNWKFVIFRIETKYINNKWNILGFSWGDDQLEINFLGFHITSN